MKIGLLLCDHVSDHFLHHNGDYDRQFSELLPLFDWTYYDLTAGHFPTSLEECDAFICSGSKYSVYDEVDWIIELKFLVKEIFRQGKPFVGVCFGHQMMAEALGGEVRKASCGWCVGVHTFRLIRRENWMKPFHREVNLLMSCQDQVLALPPDSVLLAETADCRVGMYRVGERMLGIQAHPEFSVAYSRELMMARQEKIGAEKVKEGIDSLDKALNSKLLADWIYNFLEKK